MALTSGTANAPTPKTMVNLIPKAMPRREDGVRAATRLFSAGCIPMEQAAYMDATNSSGASVSQAVATKNGNAHKCSARYTRSKENRSAKYPPAMFIKTPRPYAILVAVP